MWLQEVIGILVNSGGSLKGQQSTVWLQMYPQDVRPGRAASVASSSLAAIRGQDLGRCRWWGRSGTVWAGLEKAPDVPARTCFLRMWAFWQGTETEWVSGECGWEPACPELAFHPVENLKPFNWESESPGKKLSYVETDAVSSMKCRGGGSGTHGF